MELHWLATAVRRAATVERTEDAVDLKYSLNLVADPEVAAVAAVRARDAQFVRAVLRELDCAVEQPDRMTVRLSIDVLMDLWTAAAA